MASPDSSKQQGKRVGAHPVLVILGVIAAIWLIVALMVPKSDKRHMAQLTTPEGMKGAPLVKETDEIVSFRVSATFPDKHAIGLLVPPQATDSQVAALLVHLRHAHESSTLDTMIPATTPDGGQGEFSIADIYVFSDKHYATEETLRSLARGAHAPGELYPTSMPFEKAMAQVRGRYTIDLSHANKPEQGMLGYGDDSTGVYSKRYRPLF